jgi:P-type Cu+ transporter
MGGILTRRNVFEVLTIGVLFVVLALYYTVLEDPFAVRALVVATLVGVIPVFYNAFLALREREWASMDMLASIALLFSMIEGEWASAVFIALMLAAARLLGKLSEERMEKSIRGLMKLKPATAKVERSGTTMVVPIEEIRVGDIVVIDAGERVAIDGEVISGEASLDESSLTGESLPVDKIQGSLVASSTLVTSGSVRVKTLRVGKDTTLEKIIRLVVSSEKEKPTIETLGAKFGKLYLISVFVGAGLILLITQNVSLVLAVVLVVCADDIAVAIPLTYLRAIGSAAKHGIVIKGGKHLEVLGRVSTIVFDKTGTLTLGKPQVVEVILMSKVSEEEMLGIGAPATKRSSHPLSRAFLLYAEGKKSIGEVDSAVVVGGKGIRAVVHGKRVLVGNEKFLVAEGLAIGAEFRERIEDQEKLGRSLIFIGEENEVLGCVAMSDTIKKQAKDTVAELKALGVSRVVMLSGDNEYAASALAKEVGITEWHAGLLPEDKVLKLKELSAEGIVAMVGDGVNDAAALSIAHVGIAMGGLGSDGAIESANIVLMHDNLSAIPDTIRLARTVRRISLQDFGIWGTTNVFGLALVFTGVIGPSGAAAYNFISDFFPLMNSARARLTKKITSL